MRRLIEFAFHPFRALASGLPFELLESLVEASGEEEPLMDKASDEIATWRRLSRRETAMTRCIVAVVLARLIVSRDDAEGDQLLENLLDPERRPPYGQRLPVTDLRTQQIDALGRLGDQHRRLVIREARRHAIREAQTDQQSWRRAIVNTARFTLGSPN